MPSCSLCHRAAEDVDHLDVGDDSIPVCGPCVAANDDDADDGSSLPWEDGWTPASAWMVEACS